MNPLVGEMEGSEVNRLAPLKSIGPIGHNNYQKKTSTENLMNQKNQKNVLTSGK